MKVIFTERAWHPNGWLQDVRIAVNSAGIIESVASGASATSSDIYVENLIPAMPNVHSHAFQRAMAGLAEFRANSDDNFWSWRQTMYGFAERMNAPALNAIATQLYSEMLTAGYSAVAEFHYLHHFDSDSAAQDPMIAAEALLAAAETTGIGLTLCPVLYLQGGFGGKPLTDKQRRFHLRLEAYCEFLEALHAITTKRGHQLGMAFHSLRAVPPAALKQALEFWRNLNPEGPVHIHIAEQTGEIEASLAWSGKRPVRWLLDEIGPDKHWCLVHATHLDSDEVRDMAASGAVAGLCPTTEANLGDGFFDIEGLQKAGGRWAIGSDSHISVSPVEELRWLEYGARLRLRKRNVVASESQPHVGAYLWREAVLGGQGPLGRVGDVMRPGSVADFLVLDAQHPLLFGLRDDALLDAWLFSGNQPLVKAVMAKGEWVVQEGKHRKQAVIADAYRRAIATLKGTEEASP